MSLHKSVHTSIHIYLQMPTRMSVHKSIHMQMSVRECGECMPRVFVAPGCWTYKNRLPKIHRRKYTSKNRFVYQNRQVYKSPKTPWEYETIYLSASVWGGLLNAVRI